MPQGVEAGSLVLPSFSRILLVTDFSVCSEAAVPFVRLLAEQYNSELMVAHVVREHRAGPLDSVPGNISPTAAAEAQMSNFLASHPMGRQLNSIVRLGGVAETVAAIILEQRIDLVVIGTHGRSGVGKLMMGSIAQAIFNVALCPVLTVSPRARMSWLPGDKLGRVLYPTDFTEETRKALPYALSLAKVGDAELLMLYAARASHGDPINEKFTQELHDRLVEMLPHAVRSWCKFDTMALPGDPADMIIRAAEEHSADFIVLGAHRIEQGPLYAAKVSLMNIAYQVVAHAHCPVLRVIS